MTEVVGCESECDDDNDAAGNACLEFIVEIRLLIFLEILTLRHVRMNAERTQVRYWEI